MNNCTECGAKGTVHYAPWDAQGYVSQGAPDELHCTKCNALQWPYQGFWPKSYDLPYAPRIVVMRIKNHYRNGSPDADAGFCLCSRTCPEHKMARGGGKGGGKGSGKGSRQWYPYAKGHGPYASKGTGGKSARSKKPSG